VGRDANPVIDQGTSIDQNFCAERPGSCIWRGWFSVGARNRLSLPE